MDNLVYLDQTAPSTPASGRHRVDGDEPDVQAFTNMITRKLQHLEKLVEPDPEKTGTKVRKKCSKLRRFFSLNSDTTMAAPCRSHSDGHTEWYVEPDLPKKPLRTQSLRGDVLKALKPASKEELLRTNDYLSCRDVTGEEGHRGPKKVEPTASISPLRSAPKGRRKCSTLPSKLPMASEFKKYGFFTFSKIIYSQTRIKLANK